YLGFTPGAPIIDGINWLPTQAGVQLAVQRCTVLIFMVFAVYLLLQSTPRLQLAAALTQLMKVLRPLGLKPDRFARRLAAALDAVPGMQAMVSNARRDNNKRQSRRDMLTTAAGLINAVEIAAQHEAVMPELPELPRLPVWQLLLPMGLLVIGSVALFTV
ncbi:MAG TPA: hypothetical protein VFP95_01625, partial [Gammaproteobacteria bacterium]|nr:hypothetical protein [Gammaproteobacteria bacterium]